jgi:hypothetical protein
VSALIRAHTRVRPYFRLRLGIKTMKSLVAQASRLCILTGSEDTSPDLNQSKGASHAPFFGTYDAPYGKLFSRVAGSARRYTLGLWTLDPGLWTYQTGSG